MKTKPIVIGYDGSESARHAFEPGGELFAVAVAATKPWRTLVHAADAHDAALILVGSHGFRGLRALALGSVSHALVHHAHQPVLAVPAPATAAARREHETERTAA